MSTILILLIVIFVIWPLLRRWAMPMVQRYMARKAEDYIRQAAGMPPRDRSRRRGTPHDNGTRREGGAYGGSRTASGYGSGRRSGYSRSGDEPIIPKEYAEDVEFVETRDYSSDTTIREEDTRRDRRVYSESQVSDAEYVMIKERRE